MTSNDYLSFEITVLDFVESQKPKDVKEIEKIAQTLHEHLEIAIQDYCDDCDIEDYEPSY